MSSPVDVSDRDGLAVVRIDRPPVNAMDLAAVQRLREVFDELAGAGGPAGIVLTGAGRVFSAGVDVRAFAGYDDDARRSLGGAINAMVSALYRLAVPVVAALNGSAVGGGLVLALACDVRLAADRPDARFALGEVTAGIPFPEVPLMVLRESMSPPVRNRMALTGEAIDVAEAHRLQVVDSVVDPAELLDRAAGEAIRRAAAPGFRAVKLQLREPALTSLAAIVASKVS